MLAKATPLFLFSNVSVGHAECNARLAASAPTTLSAFNNYYVFLCIFFLSWFFCSLLGYCVYDDPVFVILQSSSSLFSPPPVETC